MKHIGLILLIAVIFIIFGAMFSNQTFAAKTEITEHGYCNRLNGVCNGVTVTSLTHGLGWDK